ncbi:putative vacuolar amino acid transporter YPQ2 [Yarrowia sp. B02]|nr:putative vacuolar amino acid transporter YPQ2 [Yarrowia sp. B02]
MREEALKLISAGLTQLCIVIWVVALAYQCYANFRNKRVDGFSFGFLLCWIGGDTFALWGALLTHQLPFQIFLASYYCGIDVILLSQYFYYETLGYGAHKKGAFAGQEVTEIEVLDGYTDSPIEMEGKGKVPIDIRTKNVAPGNLSVTPSPNYYSISASSSVPKFIPGSVTKAFLAASFGASRAAAAPIVMNTVAESPVVASAAIPLLSAITLGIFVSYTSSLLYTVSRIPQVYKNYKRQSTENMGLAMFIAACCGNATYSMSIFAIGLTLDESVRRAFFIKEAPFVGAASITVLFDFVIFWQRWKYGEGRKAETQPLLA